MEQRRTQGPAVTAKSWVVLNADTGTCIGGKKEYEEREIASLTKVMTAYTAIKLADYYEIDVRTARVNVSLEAALVTGTTADLLAGDKLTVYDLLHAMLLPSGNDAASVLAEYFGLYLRTVAHPPICQYTDPVAIFVRKMNENAKELGLTHTLYTNPHGLSDIVNVSTAFDVARLCVAALGLPLFAEVVRKTKYACTVEDIIGSKRKQEWRQTNRLLSKGFSGIKTGTTNTAGLCLSASCTVEQTRIVIVVLSCKSQYFRWQDALELKLWTATQLLTVHTLARCQTSSTSTSSTSTSTSASTNTSSIRGCRGYKGRTDKLQRGTSSHSIVKRSVKQPA